jgi:Tfp pilus assembly protein PilN
MEININLIPPYKKEEEIKKRHLRMVLNIGWSLAGMFLLFFSFIFCLQYILNFQLESLTMSNERSSDKEKKDKIKNYEQEFRRINLESGQILKVLKDQLYWTNVFQEISGKMTEGIRIESLATKDYKVLLAGKASSRDELISFKDDLSASACFDLVDLPISNLVSKNDVSFQIDIKVKEDCLKNRKNQ